MTDILEKIDPTIKKFEEFTNWIKSNDPELPKRWIGYGCNFDYTKTEDFRSFIDAIKVAKIGFRLSIVFSKTPEQEFDENGFKALCEELEEAFKINTGLMATIDLLYWHINKDGIVVEDPGNRIVNILKRFIKQDDRY